MSRNASVQRTTRETDVHVTIDLDGTGDVNVSTGVGFYDHMLTAFGHHALFDLSVDTTGDLHIDEHHTVEDTALVLGNAIADALGDRSGIRRYGSATIPMDEAVATAVVDIGGRPYAVIDLPFTTERLGTMGTQMIPHALEAFARTAGATLNLTASGSNDHHIAEAAFKALAYAVRAAVEIDPRRTGIASTKGTA
jgi:imidazoleglycerol-phosphate dehydratase